MSNTKIACFLFSGIILLSTSLLVGKVGNTHACTSSPDDICLPQPEKVDYGIYEDGAGIAD
jgi:hypothetical protein